MRNFLQQTALFPVLCLLGLLCLSLSFNCPETTRQVANETPPVDVCCKEKALVVIVPSYNNETYCEKNIRSILEQNYTNYRVVYVDDCSNDSTMSRVLDCVRQMDQTGRFTYVRNTENVRALKNVYDIVHTCPDDAIIVLVDGDDFLSHPDVLKRINQAYCDEEVWMTYGQYVTYPGYKIDVEEGYIPQHIKKGRLRGSRRYYGHLKTFYAGLFKKIHLCDLLYEGSFFPTSYDMAIMLPMLEMSRSHAKMMKEVLYLFNTETPLSDYKIHPTERIQTEKYIASLTPYKALNCPPHVSNDMNFQTKTDILVFSFDRPLQLYAFLESFLMNAEMYGNIHVLYRTSSTDFERGYSLVKSAFPQVKFFDQSHFGGFKKSLIKMVTEEIATPYLAFAPDDLIIKEEINFARCVKTLHATGAYGYFLRLAPHIDMSYLSDEHQGTPPFLSIGGGEYLWHFKRGTGDWKHPNNLDLTICRTDEIVSVIRNIHYATPLELEIKWANYAQNNGLGICAQRSAAVNIPLNITTNINTRNMELYSTTELLNKFLAGYKMDIQILQRQRNRSACCEVYPTFTLREE